jgi:hypothetical protein
MRRRLPETLALLGLCVSVACAAGTAGRATPGAPQNLPLPASSVVHEALQIKAVIFDEVNTCSGPGNAGKFDLLFGSTVAKQDGVGIARPAASYAKKKLPNCQSEIYAVSAGFAIASGQAPVVAGRRVRAASDGTQIAIEVIEDPAQPGSHIERVYFLASNANSKVNLTVYESDEQAVELAKVTLEWPGQYYEVNTKDNDPPEVPTGTISDGQNPRNIYFAGQMYLLLLCDTRLVEGAPDGFKPNKPPVSLASRFYNLFAHPAARDGGK